MVRMKSLTIIIKLGVVHLPRDVDLLTSPGLWRDARYHGLYRRSSNAIFYVRSRYLRAIPSHRVQLGSLA